MLVDIEQFRADEIRADPVDVAPLGPVQHDPPEDGGESPELAIIVRLSD